MSHNKDDSLTCILDRFENSCAILIFKTNKKDSQELILPKRYLPKDAKVADVLHIKIFSDELATVHEKKIAQHILNEILNIS